MSKSACSRNPGASNAQACKRSATPFRSMICPAKVTITFENYNLAMTTVPFAQFFVNSLIVTSVGATIKVLLAILAVVLA